MSQPTPYSRHYNFTDWQAVNPTKPLPATQLETELNGVKLTTDGVLENLAKIQRDDGKLANQLVTPEALSAGSLAMIGTGEFNPMGAWAAATVYAVNDLVEYNQATYLCLVAHTAAIAFPTDLSAHRWLMIANGALTGADAAVDLFVGNGTQTAFTLSVTYAGNNAAQVFVNGVIQIPGQDFTISGTTLTMVTAPPAPTVAGRKTLMVRGTSVEVQLAVSAAQLSASNASGYASAASASASAASASASAAAASLDSFKKAYQGAYAGDPATRYDSSALQFGDLAYNTVLNTMRVYGSSGWQNAGVIFNPVSQTFSGNGSTTNFTLSASPGVAAALIVRIAGVVKTPAIDYTVSGTTLTFLSAPPSGTNNIAVTNFGVAGSISVPANNSVATAALQDASVTAAKLAAGAAALNLAAGSVTQAMLAAGVAGNGAAFSAYASAGTAVANVTWTKIALASEEFDTNNAFDAVTNSRFQPTVAGYYQLTGMVSANGSYTQNLCAIYKNGSLFKNGNGYSSNYGATHVGVSALVYFNGTTDYAELWFYQGSGSPLTTGTGAAVTYFQGFMARCA